MESIDDDDRIDETMDDDDDDDAVDSAASNIVPLLDLDALRRWLEELASTRPDVQTPSTRNARIHLATEALRRKDPSGRQLLAGMRKGATAALLSY